MVFLVHLYCSAINLCECQPYEVYVTGQERDFTRRLEPYFIERVQVTKSCKSAYVFPSILLKSQGVMGCQSKFLSNSFCFPLAQGIVLHLLLAPVVVLNVLDGFCKISMVPYTTQNI